MLARSTPSRSMASSAGRMVKPCWPALSRVASADGKAKVPSSCRVPDRVAVLVPVEELEAVATLATEDEEIAAEWIGPEVLRDERSQAVEALAHVRRQRAQKNPAGQSKF